MTREKQVTQQKEFDRSLCFTFYKSYHEQIMDVKRDFGLEAAFQVYEAIVNYGLYETEIKKGKLRTLVGNTTIEQIENNTVILVANDGYEYSIDGKVWQSSNVFTNLDFDKILTFYQRITGDTENISEATECLIPSAPVIQLVGATKIVVNFLIFNLLFLIMKVFRIYYTTQMLLSQCFF